MSSPLLITKLHVPVLSRQVVLRDRLLRRLTGGWRRGHRLLLVSASAGFGKTTLVVDWLGRRADWGRGDGAATPIPDVAWLSLDDSDSDLRRFITYVVAAVAVERPSVAGEVRPFLQSAQLPPVETLLTPLINAVASFPASLVLVLDDYHEIRATAVQEAVAFLIEHMPRQMSVVMMTRADPPLPLARLRSRDLLTEIRTADLRFTAIETESFLNRMMELDLAPADIVALESRTEGWIAGLQLAAVSLRGRASERVRSFIEAFSGTHRHVIDYLVEEVLSQQTEELRTFLIQTSILSPLHASLCAAVTGRVDAAEILQHLVQTNMFAVPLDEAHTWYRYHHLFAEFLRGELSVRMPDQVHDLHLRAADWYAGAGLLGQAISHTLLAGEPDRAAGMIERSAHDMLMHGDVAAVLRWFEQIPIDIVHRRTSLALIYAEALLIAGRVDQSVRLIEIVEERLRADVGGADADAIVSQVAAVRAYLAILEGNLDEGIAQIQRAMVHLPAEDSFLHATVMWLFGFMQYFDGENGGPVGLLASTTELCRVSGNQLFASLSVYVSAYMQVLCGHPRQARVLLARVAEELQQRIPTWQEELPPSLSMIYQILAECCREANQLETAKRYIAQCISLAERWGNAEVLVDSYLIQARVLGALGERAAMQRSMDRALRFVHADALSPLTVRQLYAYQARHNLFSGDLAGARRWVDTWRTAHGERPPGDARIELFIRWIEISTAARVAIAAGAHAEALHWITPLVKTMEAAGWYGIVVELLAIQAAANYAQGNLPAALTALHRALDLGEPEGYVRSFVDLGSPMAGLLSYARSHGIHAVYVAKLLAAMEAEPVPVRHPKESEPETLRAGHPCLVEPLSERELEVLRLIATGLTNREIAEQLFVAVSTVKSHINNLYSKLEVANRVQAVARAGELDLL